MDSAHRGWVALARKQRDTREHRQTVSHLVCVCVCGYITSPLQLLRVQSIARKRGTSLHLLPQGMARHTLNTSRTVWNRDQSVPCGDDACNGYLVCSCAGNSGVWSGGWG